MSLTWLLLARLFGCRYAVFLVLLALAPVTASANSTEEANRAASLLPSVDFHRLVSLVPPVLQNLFCALDSDHDDVLTKEEAASGMARSLGTDAEQFYMLWNEWRCWEKQEVSPQLIEFVASAIYLAIGRLDWGPCRVAWVLGFIKSTSASHWATNRSLEAPSNSLFVAWSVNWFRWNPDIEELYFHQMDRNRDGCLSLKEWGRHLNRSTPSSWNSYNSTYRWLAPESLHLKKFSQPPVLKGQCFDMVSWTTWCSAGLFEALKSFTKETGHCNNTQLSILQPTQDDLMGNDTTILAQDQVLALALGSGIIVCAVLFLAYCKYRRFGMNLDQERKVQNLLKAKIDTWATFDSNLSTKMASLQRSFLHSLGLEHYKRDVLRLLDVVHPADVDTIQVLLAQLKDSHHVNMLPTMATVQLVHGATGELQREYDTSYVSVELLMALGSKASVLVGLTSLGEVMSGRPTADDDFAATDAKDAVKIMEIDCASVAGASAHSGGEVILNGSDVADFDQSEAGTFRSMDATSHSGGQITGPFSSWKAHEIRELIGTRLDWEASLQDAILEDTTASPIEETMVESTQSF